MEHGGHRQSWGAVQAPDGAVYINDIQRGTNGYAKFDGTLPAGEPLTVRVEAPGFAPWEETVTLQPDAPRLLVASLTLLEPAPFQPASGLVRGELPAEFWQQLAAREGALVDCFAPLPAGQTAVARGLQDGAEGGQHDDKEGQEQGESEAAL